MEDYMMRKFASLIFTVVFLVFYLFCEKKKQESNLCLSK